MQQFEDNDLLFNASFYADGVTVDYYCFIEGVFHRFLDEWIPAEFDPSKEYVVIGEIQEGVSYNSKLIENANQLVLVANLF